jgi:hypothetical protein
MDDVLKAYGERKYSDEVMDILDFDPELGFNPYVWISRHAIQQEVERNARNPAIVAAYKRYRETLDKLHDEVHQTLREIYSEQFMKGQAFGL